MKKISFYFLIFILIYITPSFGQNRSNTEDEKRSIDFMIGYNYTPDMPLGFTIGGLSGFYASLNFNFSAASNGVTAGIGHPNGYFTGETASDGIAFLLGYSVYLKNNYLRLPVGIGMSLTEDYYLYNDNGKTRWYGNGETNNRIILEAGLQLNIFNHLYLSGTYRTIGFKTNAFAIGAGIINYSSDSSGSSSKTYVSTRDDINNTLRLVARDLKNKVDYNKDGLINCIDAAISFYKWYPDKSKVRIELNRNTKTGMHHLFNCVNINGIWRAIEPQALHMNHSNYWMHNVWGKKYDETYNSDATWQYIKFVTSRP